MSSYAPLVRPVAAQPRRLGVTRSRQSIQAKLRLGAIDDPLEREADRVAAQVTRGSDTDVSKLAPAGDVAYRSCAECRREDDDDDVRRKEVPGTGAEMPNLEARVQRARTGGREIAPQIRADMEARFRRDFSQVRVHDDPQAGAAARAIRARAFTVRNDIFFGRGEYRPEAASGRFLLAHELTHVLQQSGDTEPRIQRSPLVSGSPATIAKHIVDAAESTTFPTTSMCDDLRAYIMALPDVLPLIDELMQHLDEASLLALARSFVANVTDDEVSKLLQTPSGHTVLTVMIGFSDLPFPLAGPVSRYFGKISDTARNAIEAKNFPSGERVDETDYPNYCMHAVLFNLETAVGVPSDMIEAKAKDIRARKRGAAKMAGKKGSKEGTKPLNSENLQAATELGVARPLGTCERSRAGCEGAIEYDPARSDHKLKDPFRIKGAKEAATVFAPNPERLMLDAVAGADVGTYMFSASIVEHHSVTFLLTKNAPGRLGLGSKDYQIHWNDQYEDGLLHRVRVPDDVKRSDGLKYVDIDDGLGVGILGEKVKGLDLVKKLFYYTSTKLSRPDRETFWSDKANFTKFNATQDKSQELKRLAEKQRCSNLAKIQLWHVIPR